MGPGFPFGPEICIVCDADGKLSFASESSSGNSNAYSDGFSVAEQLVSVAIGLTVGLFVSAVVTNPLGGGRRTGSGIFAF